MFMDCVQTIIPRQQSTKKMRQASAKRLAEIVWIVMADMQSDGDAVTAQNNLLQLRAVSSSIRMQLMEVTHN
jgi:uncharacterized phosphosugar-binding protein